MDNNIEIKNVTENIAVVSLNYQTIGTANGNDIQKQIAAFIKSGKNRIVLDLKNVSNANSFGLSLFFRIKNNLKETGGELVIINISSRLQELLKTAGLFDYFEFRENETDAVQFLKTS